MRWNLNEWLRIASNLAVLIGLILIYAEIHNNTFVTRAVLIDSGMVQWSEVQRGFVDEGMAEVWVKAMSSPTDLTAAERARLNERFERLLLLYLRERVFVDFDIYEEWEGIIGATAFFFTNPYGRAFWAVRREGIDSRMVAAVDRALEGLDSDVYAQLDSAIVKELEQQQKRP